MRDNKGRTFAPLLETDAQCVCMHVCEWVCVCVCVCVCQMRDNKGRGVCVRCAIMYVCMYVYARVLSFKKLLWFLTLSYKKVPTHACMYVCNTLLLIMCMCMPACMYVCMHACMVPWAPRAFARAMCNACACAQHTQSKTKSRRGGLLSGADPDFGSGAYMN